MGRLTRPLLSSVAQCMAITSALLFGTSGSEYGTVRYRTVQSYGQGCSRHLEYGLSRT